MDLRTSPADIEHLLRTAPAATPFPPAADRAAWERAAALRPRLAAHIIAGAERAAAEPVPPLSATDYLHTSRTGQRERYERPMRRRREMLAQLAVAECLEYSGRFLDPLLDVVWAICEESAWIFPAHVKQLADPARPRIDLLTAMTVLELAEADALLGGALDPAAGPRIRHEAERRVFAPYLSGHHEHWMHLNTVARGPGARVGNWTAVCTAGIVGAALYLEPDPARTAEIVFRGMRSLEDYVAGFDANGGSSEGLGYWTYGFGYYTLLAHLLRDRTGGGVDLLAGERMAEICRYPLRTRLSSRAHACFSDADPAAQPDAAHLAHLADRLGLPGLEGLAPTSPDDGSRRSELHWLVRRTLWTAPEDTPPPALPSEPVDWFPDLQWLIARQDPADDDALVVAVKGGTNNELHNQNDVGSLIVHLGGESLVADPGRGRYTLDYFGPDRYRHFANSSDGHSVPQIDGAPQGTGGDYAARVLHRHSDGGGDSVTLDLLPAYPADAGVSALRRTVTLDRAAPGGAVELVDEYAFDSAAGPAPAVATALTTSAEVTVGDHETELRGTRASLRITFDPTRVACTVTTVKDVDMPEGPTTYHRVLFTPRTSAEPAEVRLRMHPVTATAR